MKIVMKKAQLKTIFFLSVAFSLMSILAYAAVNVIHVQYPNNQWVQGNSVNFNFTANSTSATIDYCELRVNNSGTFAVKANYTNVVNATPHVAGVVINNSNNLGYGWNVTCYNGSSEFFSSLLNFGVDGNAPSVILDEPASGTYIQNLNNTMFRYTPTDASNPDTCLFYTNISGTWKNNQTNASYVSGTQILANLTVNANNYTAANIPDGNYIWNAYCNDSAANSAWGSQNFSFVVDSVDPAPIKTLVPVNNSYTNDSTPYIAWNQTTEANFDKYTVKLSPNRNMSSPTQAIEVSSRTTNYTNMSNIENDGTYYIQVNATDLSGRFTVSDILYINLDTSTLIVTLNDPSANSSFTSDTTPDINVTVIDLNPDTCDLLLTNRSGDDYFVNATVRSITNGTQFNLTVVTAMAEGVYHYNVECNDTSNNRANVSASPLNITIDTVASPVSIISTFHQTNNTDRSPQLKWNTTDEGNFSKYMARAYYANNNSVAYEINVTTRAQNYTEIQLVLNEAYNFSVTTFDLAGNSIQSLNNTLGTRYYVDPVCSILNAGWNMCGAVWTIAKSLSLIANETGANQVAVFNSSHAFATCNAAVSTTGLHCEATVNISSITSYNSSVDTFYNPKINHVVFIYVNASMNWSNRTWAVTERDSNITLTNASGIGWNPVAGFIRGSGNNRYFGHLGKATQFGTQNVSQWSMILNNGSTIPYVNNGNFAALNNQTNLTYGRAMWAFLNMTGGSTLLRNATFVPAGW